MTDRELPTEAELNALDVTDAEEAQINSIAQPLVPGAAPDADDRPLLHRFVHAGELAEGWTGPEAVTRAAERHAASLRELSLIHI